MTAVPEILKTLWFLHGATHWIVWLGFLYTCYYFRYFIGRIMGDPSDCGVPEEKKDYKEEGGLKQWHGVFVWLVIAETAIYVLKLVLALSGYDIYPPEKAGIKITIGLINVAATILLLSSCHYVRFLGGSGTKCFSCLPFGRQRQKVFTLQTFLNNYHGHFFWILVLSAVVIHFI